MDLQPGTSLLHYRIVDKLGEGGMGVVWKALDTTLDREVAIKVLPAQLTADAERLARFEREAKLLASLNHPHIAAIYGLQEHEGTRFIAMEMIAGEDLSELLSRGALTLERTVELGRQIAVALESAHEQGVIHRDLKPANVKLTMDGDAKILDFGLAKAFEPDPTASGVSATMSPTMTSAGSMIGVILGTAAYMSPQQARGHVVDKRADVFSFGCMLFEMLSGKLAFPGETVSDTLAAVLKLEPDWGALPSDLPPTMLKLVRRCLQKDARKRLRDIGEARIWLESIQAGEEPTDAVVAAPLVQKRGSRLPWLVAAAASLIALALALSSLWGGGDESPPTPHRLRVQLGEPMHDVAQNFAGAAAVLSPDGDRIAFVVGNPRQLYIRRTGDFDAIPLSGTKDAGQPFFSPDGQWIGFVQDRELRKISVLGGATVKICEVARFRGATWLPDGTIIIAPTTSGGLFQVPAVGGEPQPLTDLALDEVGIRSHRWPHALPDGRRVLFTVQEAGTAFDDARIDVIDMETKQTRTIHRGGSFARYAASGHVTYVHKGTLFALPVDPKTLEVIGPAFPTVENVVHDSRNGGARYDVSPQGHLLYTHGIFATATRVITWVNPDGSQTPILSKVEDYRNPRLSPDETRLSFSYSDSNGEEDIWVYDLERGTSTRLTFRDGMDRMAIWSNDGTRLYYAGSSGGFTPNIESILADGSGEPESDLEQGRARLPSSISPDGRFLLYKEEAGTGWDMWALDLETKQPSILIDTEFVSSNAEVSPDGDWTVYESNESGDWHVYVRRFPEGPGKWQISNIPAGNPTWSRDGRAVYFVSNSLLYTVDVEQNSGSIQFSVPRLVMDSPVGPAGFLRNYDVSSSGRVLAAVSLATDENDVPIEDRLILNWFEELRSN